MLVFILDIDQKKERTAKRKGHRRGPTLTTSRQHTSAWPSPAVVLPSALIQDGPRTPTQTNSSANVPHAWSNAQTSGQPRTPSPDQAAAAESAGAVESGEAIDKAEIEEGERAGLTRQPAAGESSEADDDNGDRYIEDSSGLVSTGDSI